MRKEEKEICYISKSGKQHNLHVESHMKAFRSRIHTAAVTVMPCHVFCVVQIAFFLRYVKISL